MMGAGEELKTRQPGLGLRGSVARGMQVPGKSSRSTPRS